LVNRLGSLTILVNQVNGFRNLFGISNLVVNQLAFNTPHDSPT